MVVNGTVSNDDRSSASVTRKASRTLVSLRMESRTPDVTSWRKITSGVVGASRMWLRRSLERASGSGEKASMFHDTREAIGAAVPTLDGGGAAGSGEGGGECGTQRRVEPLKAERARQTLFLPIDGGTVIFSLRGGVENGDMIA